MACEPFQWRGVTSSVHGFGHQRGHAHGDGVGADVGERIVVAREPFSFGKIALELAHRISHLAPLLLEHRLAETFTGIAPFHLLLEHRHPRHVGFELVLRHVAHEQLAQLLPAQGRDAPAEIFVDELGPDAHLGAPVEVLRPQRHLVGEAAVEIFADHGGFGDHAAVVDGQRRHLAAGIDLHEFRIVLLELREVDEAVDVFDVLLGQHQQRLQRIRAGAAVIKLQAHLIPFYAAALTSALGRPNRLCMAGWRPRPPYRSKPRSM